MSIALTDVCDLKCRFCYAPKSRHRLDPIRLREWLVELDEHQCLAVGFGGGEPTLHPDLVSICTFAAENTGMAITMTTHGHSLTAAMSEELSRVLHFMRISMDGVGTTYERQRGRSFGAFLTQLELISRTAKFGINCVINTETVHELDQVADVAIQYGAAELLLLPQQQTRLVPGVDAECLALFRKWVRCFRGPIRLAVSENYAEGFDVARPFDRGSTLESFAHVDAHGVLKRTSFDSIGEGIGATGLMEALERLLSKEEDRDENLEFI